LVNSIYSFSNKDSCKTRGLIKKQDKMLVYTLKRIILTPIRTYELYLLSMSQQTIYNNILLRDVVHQAGSTKLFAQ
ncbi:MAG: hypothetical protein ACJ72R_17540, partial [Nitrososphaeraceae archaeon]